jgi:hypothetical protein
LVLYRTFAFLTGSQIEAPKFTTPGQALTFSITALTATLGYGIPTSGEFDRVSFAAWLSTMTILGGTLISAAGSILMASTAITSTRGKLATSGYIIATYLGRPPVVTSFVFLFAVLTYHRANTLEAHKVTIGWSMLVFARPIENFFMLTNRKQTGTFAIRDGRREISRFFATLTASGVTNRDGHFEVAVNASRVES